MSSVAVPASDLTESRLLAWVSPLGGLVLSSAASVVCLLVAGPLHGVLFGACVAGVLLTPALVSAELRWHSALLTTVAIAIGCAVGPLVALLQGELNGRLFSTLVAVTAPLVLALGGLTALLVGLRVVPAIAVTLLTVIALAWLGWPVWLSPWLAGNESLVSLLSPAHPLLVIDAAIVREGGTPWMEHRLMYAKLTVLGQHVFPRPPQGVGAAVLFHGAVGLVAFLPVIGVQLWSNRKRQKHTKDWDEFEAV